MGIETNLFVFIIRGLDSLYPKLTKTAIIINIKKVIAYKNSKLLKIVLECVWLFLVVVPPVKVPPVPLSLG